MNPADPLEQLHPLREPALIDWWPLAPGWWLLLALLLLSLAGFAWLLLSRYRRNAYRRLGAEALGKIRAQHSSDGDDRACLTAINALLKSLALKAWPRRDVANISGEQWLEFLNSTMPAGPRFEEAFIGAQYRKNPGSINFDHLYSAAVHWIKHHEARRD